MTRRLRRLIERLVPASLRREDGTASMEFVLVVPVILMIFMASFETGLLMTREILLEQSVDMTMRELRLGHYANVTNQLLKQQICNRTIIFPDCMSNIKIELVRVSTTDWTFPATPAVCVNSSTPAEPVTVLKYGEPNDLMLIRACISLPAMFPGTGLALQMKLDSSGNYALVARSAFVVEPM